MITCTYKELDRLCEFRVCVQPYTLKNLDLLILVTSDKTITSHYQKKSEMERKKQDNHEERQSTNNGPSKLFETDEPSKNHLLSHPVEHFAAEEGKNASGVLSTFTRTGFQSRNLGRCYKVLLDLLKDPERPIVFMSLAGAMVPGGLRKVISDMIKLHIVDVLVSTGANLYHDFYESMGYRHYLAQDNVDDVFLRKKRVNRMLDIYADDDQFTTADAHIVKLTEKLPPNRYSTREYLHFLGSQVRDPDSILGVASRENVPVFCPAISDSSIGIALAAYVAKRVREDKPYLTVDVIKDNLEAVSAREQAPKSAAIVIGGGVPKNFIQQIAPMGEVVGIVLEGHTYGVQITTDDPKWGGLSGCTFQESQSWGKYVNGASLATVYADATIALPILFQGLIDQKKEWHPRSPFKFDWTQVLDKTRTTG